MRVLFLGDIVGNPGRNAITRELKDQILKNDIEFVIANGENAADEGVGITKKISDRIKNYYKFTFLIFSSSELSFFTSFKKLKKSFSLCFSYMKISIVISPELP